MKTRVLGVAACVAVALAACTTTRTSAHSYEADVAAITAFNSQYLKAINDGDIVALSALTDADHIMIVPNRALIVGKAANDAANGRAFEQFKFDEHWMPVETVVDGNLAYQRGTFSVTASPKSSSGASRTTRGNFLRIYRRQGDGSWRMTRDMFNSDQAP
jgi:ketosteroid isomerase-like protein